MGPLTEYFSKHASYNLFDIVEFIKIQNCPTKKASIKNFKRFIEKKIDKSKCEKAKHFSNQLKNDNYCVLKQESFLEYWRLKDLSLTRTKLRIIDDKQIKNLVKRYDTVFGFPHTDDNDYFGTTTTLSHEKDDSLSFPSRTYKPSPELCSSFSIPSKE